MFLSKKEIYDFLKRFLSLIFINLLKISLFFPIGAEGSVRTVTTPISTRYPAENTTPSPQPNEYSYDNQGLVVTPVSDKPSGGVTF